MRGPRCRHGDSPDPNAAAILDRPLREPDENRPHAHPGYRWGVARALAVTRSLGRAGHHVVTAERTPKSLAQSSRYSSASFAYPSPLHDEPGFVEELLKSVRDHRIDVLLPVADVTTALVMGNRSRFEPFCAIPLASASAIARAADKVDILRTAARLGIPTPRTVFVETPADARLAARELPYPIVIKPRRSRLRTASGWLPASVSYARTPDRLVEQLESCPVEAFPILLQERIEGPGLGAFMCYSRGRPIAEFGHRRLREKPPTGGVSVLCESVALTDDARRYSCALLEELGWQGVAMVEFKQDCRDGQPKLMEINGRFWGSLQLAIDAGVDFPSILLTTLNDDASPQPLSSYRVGVKSRWLWGDRRRATVAAAVRHRHGRRPSARRGRFLEVLGARFVLRESARGRLETVVHETAQRLRALSGLNGRH